MLETALAALLWGAALFRIMTVRDGWVVTFRSPGSWRVLAMLCAGATVLSLTTPVVDQLLDAGDAPETLGFLLIDLAALWLAAQVMAIIADAGPAPAEGTPSSLVSLRHYVAAATTCAVVLVLAFVSGGDEPSSIFESRTFGDTLVQMVKNSHMVVVGWVFVEVVRMSYLLRGSRSSGTYLSHLFATIGAAGAVVYVLCNFAVLAIGIVTSDPSRLVGVFDTTRAVCAVIAVVSTILMLEAADRRIASPARHWNAWRVQRSLQDLRHRLVTIMPQYAFPERGLSPHRALTRTVTEIHDCLLRMAPFEPPCATSQAESIASVASRRGSTVPPPILVWAARVELTRRSLLSGPPLVREARAVLPGGGLADPDGVHLTTENWSALAAATRDVDDVLARTEQEVGRR